MSDFTIADAIYRGVLMFGSIGFGALQVASSASKKEGASWWYGLFCLFCLLGAVVSVK